LMRFEEPSSMVRWDSPLISIPWDEEPPYDEIWNVVMKGEKKGPTAATLQVRLLSLCLGCKRRGKLI
jgi:protein KTI12